MPLKFKIRVGFSRKRIKSRLGLSTDFTRVFDEDEDEDNLEDGNEWPWGNICPCRIGQGLALCFSFIEN